MKKESEHNLQGYPILQGYQILLDLRLSKGTFIVPLKKENSR